MGTEFLPHTHPFPNTTEHVASRDTLTERTRGELSKPPFLEPVESAILLPGVLSSKGTEVYSN